MNELIEKWCGKLKQLPLAEQVEALNVARKLMHESGPFASEPVDCVQWKPLSAVTSNDYNPNSVAPPEMESKCWAPSWRRMCKVLLRNDYWCKGLGQTQPKSEAYGKYIVIRDARRAAEKAAKKPRRKASKTGRTLFDHEEEVA